MFSFESLKLRTIGSSMSEQQIVLLEDVCQKIYSTHDAAERKSAEQVKNIAELFFE